ncbi:MAG: glutamate racemase [Fimbriimonas sp.]
MKIGICDWGIGGLGFYRLLREERPDIDVTYLGDQGMVSYGRLPRPELTARVKEVLAGFRERGVSRVVVACNAASTVLPYVQVADVDASGVILPALKKLRAGSGPVGVIGGVRTIRSGAYRRALVEMGYPVRQRVAQPLSRLIEDGLANDPATLELLKQILAPIRNSERLVLACTHYVVLAPVIQAFMPHATLIDPAAEVWASMKESLPPKQDRIGSTEFFSTGECQAMETQALAAFGVTARVQRWS